MRDSALLNLLSSAGRPRDLAVKLARLYQRDRWRFSPRRLDRLVDVVPLDRPIFLLGVAGCGGTLKLAALLGYSSPREGARASNTESASPYSTASSGERKRSRSMSTTTCSTSLPE
jgi:hypothetical protein